jgi:hypothetical protein
VNIIDAPRPGDRIRKPHRYAVGDTLNMKDGTVAVVRAVAWEAYRWHPLEPVYQLETIKEGSAPPPLVSDSRCW